MFYDDDGEKGEEVHAEMNRTVKELAGICEKNLLTEKLLFVPSHSVGHQIGQWLARTGTPWINLRFETFAGFAAETCFTELTRAGIHFIDSDERLAVVEDLFRTDAYWKSDGRYFAKASDIPGLMKALNNTIHELRMAGLTPDMIDASVFLVAEKGQELVALLRMYESILEERKLIDHAGLLKRASEIVAERPMKERMVMVLSDYPVTFVERRLIECVARDRLIVVAHDQPVGAIQPPAFVEVERKDRKPEPQTDCERLTWILDPQSAPPPFGDNTVTLFHALGESNEVRDVFRRVLASGTPIDNVELVVPVADPYASLIRDIAISLNLPVTYASGIPLVTTRPGCALLGYLKWQAEDFADRHLRHLLSGGHIDLKGFEDEPPLSPRQAATLFREAQIGWGRGRYSFRLASLAEMYAAKAEGWRAEGEDQKALWAEGTGKKVRWLQGWVEKILGATPHIDEMSGVVERNSFYDSCLSFVQRNCRIGGDLDAAAKTRIIELLQALKRGPTLLDPVRVLISRVTETIGTLAVGHSAPTPGALHVADYRSAGWSGRTVTFVMGLDQTTFPGPLSQDPIILDEERTLLSPNMKPSAEIVKEKTYVMAKLLASLNGHVTISCSCRDLLDDRELMPSSLVLNAYRLIAGRPLADYSECSEYLGEPAGFEPESSASALNEWEWWLSLCREGNCDPTSVLACYPELARGTLAMQARTTERMTCYDGYVPSSEGALNPFEKQRIFSASQVENLATCPFRFFMTYLLHIEPLEDLEKDPNQWLQGAPRGTLLHDVFRRFMESLGKYRERPDHKAHWGYLKELAIESIEKWKHLIPPPSTFAYEREVREILQTCETFLREEEERCRTIEPRFFELSFGVKSEDGQARHDAVEIVIKGKGSFLLRGRIDRVDKCGEHFYEVWDYKTGSPYGYKESDYYKNGRHMQHVLYSMAAEELLRQHYDREASVIRGGYYFPGPKGEGLRIERDETKREEAFRILNQLFSLLVSGAFPSAYDSGGCSFCLYSPACGGGEKAVARCRQLLAGSESLLDPLRRLVGNE